MSSTHFFIFIDSRNKITGTNSNFNLSMNDHNVEPGINVAVSLDECTFYNMQYPINSTNNSIVFQENDTASDITATLTPGNYTGSEIATEIQTQFNSVGANTYSVSYNENTGKLTIAGLTLPDDVKLISINEIYGFNAGSSFAASIVGDNQVSLAGFEYVDLLLPSLLSNNITTNNNTNGIIKRIPLDLPWGSLITYKQQESDQSVIINKEYLNNLTCRLRNPNATDFDLPDNAYLSIVLKCTYIF
jgi:hypothetical protein